MMALWSSEGPTHLVACNEQYPDQAGLLRVRLPDGRFGTILSGTRSRYTAHTVEHPVLGHIYFEGVVIYPNDVMYHGDKSRTPKRTAGGACFKYIHSSPWNSDAPISDLDQSLWQMARLRSTPGQATRQYRLWPGGNANRERGIERMSLYLSILTLSPLKPRPQ